MSNPDDDKRRDEVIKRMLQTPPKKQAELKKALQQERQGKSASTQGRKRPRDF